MWDGLDFQQEDSIFVGRSGFCGREHCVWDDVVFLKEGSVCGKGWFLSRSQPVSRSGLYDRGFSM